MLVIAILLLILGLASGSFVNALVWRLHQQSLPKNKRSKADLSIVKGRSICPDCGHKLAWYDLIPLGSWIMLQGRCRYCKKPIQDSPLVEIVSGVVFASSYIFWPLTPHLYGQWLLLSTWLAVSVGLLALAVYDIRWMLLPSKIIYPILAIAVAGRSVYIAIFASRPAHSLMLWLFSIVIASGVFYILYMVSRGNWIGYGDVRLGLVTGTLLADPQKSFAMIFIASLLGTIIILPALMEKSKTMVSKLPYGPFLIAATGIMVIFGDPLINWYNHLFGL